MKMLLRTLFLMLITLCRMCAADAQAPQIVSSVPPGGRRGSVMETTLLGPHMNGPIKLLVSGRGVKAEVKQTNADGQNLPLRLTIAPEAPLGPVEIRIATPRGVSNPTRFWIDDLPEGGEAEPNDGPAQAQPLKTLPVVINAMAQVPADRDTFAFDAEAGETFVFDLNCWRHRSGMDGVLELRDAQGGMLQLASAPWESDPRLIYTFSKPGRYTLTVHDTQFHGGPQFTYRLSVGKFAALTRFQPRAGQPGQKLALTGAGVNLPSAAAGTWTMQASLPAEPAPEGIWWIAPEMPGGMALPIPIAASDLPAVEARPGLMLPSFPVAVNGVMQEAGRAETFRFAAKSGQKLRFDVLAQRLGAQMDSAIRLLDANGKELAANDDGGTLLAGTAAGIGRDSRLEWACPADGEYRIEIVNRTGEAGPGCFYRLEIAPVAPDFRLLLNETGISLAQGGAALVTLHVERAGGFADDVAVRAEGLPPGVAFSDGLIPAGQGSAEFTLTAEPGAALDLREIRFLGAATAEGKHIEREAVAREQYLPRAIDPGMFTDDSYRRPYRACLLLPLAVTELAESFTLRADADTPTLAPGQSVTLKIRALRKPDTDGEIKLAVRGLPQGYKADLKPIAPKTSEAVVTLTAPAKVAAPRALRLIFTGTLDKQTQVCPLLTVNSTAN